MLRGYIGLIGAVRPARQFFAIDQAPPAIRRKRTPN
jgi:hypothetical protein